jgi:hypothetical protein
MRIGGLATTTVKKAFSLPTTSSWISRFASSFCCLQRVRLGEDDRRFGRCVVAKPIFSIEKQSISFSLIAEVKVMCKTCLE